MTLTIPYLSMARGVSPIDYVGSMDNSRSYIIEKNSIRDMQRPVFYFPCVCDRCWCQRGAKALPGVFGDEWLVPCFCGECIIRCDAERQRHRQPRHKRHPPRVMRHDLTAVDRNRRPKRPRSRRDEHRREAPKTPPASKNVPEQADVPYSPNSPAYTP
jgi:hypothetical protein